MELKIGDRIYGKSYNSITAVYVVERVTNTQAICQNDIRFKKVFANWINRVGNNGYDRTMYYIETPELKDLLFRQNAIYKVDKFNYSKLTTDQLKAIISILETVNP